MESTNRREITLRGLDLLNLKSKNRITPYTKEIMISCPFHKDKTPSLGVDVENGRCHCFSCGFAGSIESLYREVTGQSLKAALGISSDKFSNFRAKGRFEFASFNSLDNSLRNVFLNFNKKDFISLNEKPEAIEYLKQRGIDLNTAREMNIKYVESTRINGTLFYRRLVIPVYENNKLISIEGRRLFPEDPNPKVLYPKNCTVNTLYDIDNLDRSKPLYACEGLMDLAVLRSCEFFKNSTSIFGANLTSRQINLLKEFKEVIYIPDRDEAGNKTVEALKNASLNNCWILSPPKSLNGFEIKDIGDVPKAGCSIQSLLDRRWLLYKKPLESMKTN